MSPDMPGGALADESTTGVDAAADCCAVATATDGGGACGAAAPAAANCGGSGGSEQLQQQSWGDAEAAALAPAGGVIRGRARKKCQVEGCNARLPPPADSFYMRQRICVKHYGAAAITDSLGRSFRFCQQCTRLHPLPEFDGAKRNCRDSLQRRKERRLKAAATKRAAEELSGSGSGSTGSGSASASRSASRSGTVRRSTRVAAAAVSGGTASPSASGAAVSVKHEPLPSPPTTRSSPPLPSPLASPLAAPIAGDAGSGCWVAMHLVAPAELAAPVAGVNQLNGMLLPAPAPAPQWSSALPAWAVEGQPPAALSAPPAAAFLGRAAPTHAAASYSNGHQAAAVPYSNVSAQMLAAPPAFGAAAPLSAAAPHANGRAPVPGGAPHPGWAAPVAAPVPAAAPDSLLQAWAEQGFMFDAQIDELLDMSADDLAHALAPVWDGTHPVAPHATLLPSCSQPPPAPAPALQASPAQFEELRVSLKLYGTTPEQLPPTLRHELLQALQLGAPSLASVRTGCVHLTLSALADAEERARFAAPGAAAQSLLQVQHLAPQAPRLLLQAGCGSAALLVRGAAGQPSVLLSLARPDANTALLPQISLLTPLATTVAVANGCFSLRCSPALLCGGSGSRMRLALHCRRNGRHEAVSLSLPAAGDLSPPTANAAEDVDSGSDGAGSDEDSGASGDADGAAALAGGDVEAEAFVAAATLVDDEGNGSSSSRAGWQQAGWGLFEFEVSQGPLLGRAEPVLVLPDGQEAAAAELAAVPRSERSVGVLRLLGTVLHFSQGLADWQRSQQVGSAAGRQSTAAGGAEEEYGPDAVARVAAAAMQLQALALQSGWPAVAQLLAPVAASLQRAVSPSFVAPAAAVTKLGQEREHPSTSGGLHAASASGKRSSKLGEAALDLGLPCPTERDLKWRAALPLLLGLFSLLLVGGTMAVGIALLSRQAAA